MSVRRRCEKRGGAPSIWLIRAPTSPGKKKIKNESVGSFLNIFAEQVVINKHSKLVKWDKKAKSVQLRLLREQTGAQMSGAVPRLTPKLLLLFIRAENRFSFFLLLIKFQ